MRNVSKTILLVLLLGVTATTIGQEPARRPGLFTRAVSAIALDKADGGIVRTQAQVPVLPQADNNASVTGSTVTDRLNAIRRRVVDSSIGNSFTDTAVQAGQVAKNAAVDTAAKAIQTVKDATKNTAGSVANSAAKAVDGTLPSVKRRPLNAMPEPMLPQDARREAVRRLQEIKSRAATPPAAETISTTPIEPTEMKVTKFKTTPIETKTVDVEPTPTIAGPTPAVRTEPMSPVETAPLARKPIPTRIETTPIQVKQFKPMPLVESTPTPQPAKPAPARIDEEQVQSAIDQIDDMVTQVPETPRPVKVKKTLPKPTVRKVTPEAKRNLLLSNEAPALSFKTAGPRTIVIGKEATYRVTMVNRGSVDARNVICTVKLPMWAEVVGNSASTGSPVVDVDDTNAMHVVSWEIASLPAGGDETLGLRIVPRDSRPFDLAVGWAFAPGQTTAQITVQEPKLELSMNGPEEVEYGETDVYTITLSNPGTGLAENVVLNLLPMTAYQQIAGTRNMGNIKPGERKTLELELTAHQAGQLQVRAMAYADNGLRAEVTQKVQVRRANLEVVVMGPPRNFAATSAVYKVRIENTGDAMAKNMTAVASLPAGARFIQASDAGKFDPQRAQVQWQIGKMRSGGVRVLEMQCELNNAGENRVDIQAQSTHDISVNESIVTMVEALADLKLYVNDPQGAVPVGSESQYEVRIVNRGTKAAENVQVVGYFSEGVEPELIRGGRGEVSTGQVVFDPIQTIAPGQEVVFHITARASEPGNHVFRAEMECRVPDTRLANEEWTRYYVDVNSRVRQAKRSSGDNRQK